MSWLNGNLLRKGSLVTAKVKRRPLLAALLFVPLLAGCSFSPVYQNTADPAARAGRATFGFSYDRPKSGLEQIVYQALDARLPASAPRQEGFVTVSLSSSGRTVGRTATASVFNTQQSVLTANVIVYKSQTDRSILFSIKREKAALFESSGQLLADQAARQNAEERAAHSLADDIRLALYARFAQGAQNR